MPHRQSLSPVISIAVLRKVIRVFNDSQPYRRFEATEDPKRRMHSVFGSLASVSTAFRSRDLSHGGSQALQSLYLLIPDILSATHSTLLHLHAHVLLQLLCNFPLCRLYQSFCNTSGSGHGFRLWSATISNCSIVKHRGFYGSSPKDCAETSVRFQCFTLNRMIIEPAKAVSFFNCDLAPTVDRED